MYCIICISNCIIVYIIQKQNNSLRFREIISIMHTERRKAYRKFKSVALSDFVFIRTFFLLCFVTIYQCLLLTQAAVCFFGLSNVYSMVIDFFFSLNISLGMNLI